MNYTRYIQYTARACLFLALFLVLFGSGLLYKVKAQESNVYPLGEWAWGAEGTSLETGGGVGWIDLSKIVLDPNSGALSGYGWSDNFGLLRFGDLSGFPFTDNEYCGSSGDCNAHFFDKKIYGWARFCNGFQTGCSGASRDDGWDGWVSLRKGNQYGVEEITVYDEGTNIETKTFFGYAWGGGKIGWIQIPEIQSQNSKTGLSCEIYNKSPAEPDAEKRSGLPSGQVGIFVDDSLTFVLVPAPERGATLSASLNPNLYNETVNTSNELEKELWGSGAEVSKVFSVEEAYRRIFFDNIKIVDPISGLDVSYGNRVYCDDVLVTVPTPSVPAATLVISAFKDVSAVPNPLVDNDETTINFGDSATLAWSLSLPQATTTTTANTTTTTTYSVAQCSITQGATEFKDNDSVHSEPKTETLSNLTETKKFLFSCADFIQTATQVDENGDPVLDADGNPIEQVTYLVQDGESKVADVSVPQDEVTVRVVGEGKTKEF